VRTPCDRPLELRTLADYWLDDDGHDHEELEEHLFACDSCSRRLHGMVALGAGVGRLVREGAVELVVTRSLLARAARDGLRIREYRLAPGESVRCTVTTEDDLLVSRLVGRFEGVSRLDVVAEQEGLPVRRIQDVPFELEAGELIVAQAMPDMRRLQRARLRVRLLSHEESGERLIGEYTFEHYPTPWVAR
jgi:hypothetical protein